MSKLFRRRPGTASVVSICKVCIYSVFLTNDAFRVIYKISVYIYNIYRYLMYNAERGVIDTYLIFSGNVESNSHKLLFVSDILSTFIL